MKYTYFKNNFTSGETTELLESQGKLARFKNSAQSIKNFIALTQGGIERRSGTQRIAEVPYVNSNSKLVPFIASETIVMMLDFFDEKISFYKNKEPVFSGGPLFNGTFESNISGWDISGDSTNYAQWDSFNKKCYLVGNPTGSGTHIGIWQNVGLLGSATYTFTADIENNDCYFYAATSPSIYAAHYVQYLGQGVGRIATYTNTNFDNNIYIGLVSFVSPGQNARVDNLTLSQEVYQISSPYDQGIIPELYFEQNNNQVLITHNNYYPRQLYRTSDKSWVLDLFKTRDGPYSGDDFQPGTSSCKVSLSGTFGNVIVTATEPIFVYTDVGRHFRYRQGPKASDYSRDYAGTGAQLQFDIPFVFETPTDVEVIKYAATGAPTVLSYPGNFSISGQTIVLPAAPTTDERIVIKPANSLFGRWGWGIITNYISATQVIVSVEEGFEGTALSDEWKLGAFSTTTGFPRACCFHKQRTVFGGTVQEPDAINASQIAQYKNFSPDNFKNTGEVDPDGALSLKVATRRGEAIQWFLSKGDLFIGTTLGVNLLRSSTDGENITPQNAAASHGVIAASSKNKPVVADNSLIFLEKRGKKLFSLSFRADLNQFNSPDLLLLSEHLTDYKFISLDVQYYPETVIWAVREDGKLVSVTFNSVELVSGPTVHELGANSEGAKVLDVAVIPSLVGDDDEVWLKVYRKVDGKDKYFIEVLDPRNRRRSLIHRAFLDSYTLKTGNQMTVVTGLDSYNNETVNVVTDGVHHPDCIVSNNQITLNWPADVVMIGYNYESFLRLHDFPVDLPIGSQEGLIKRITELDVNFYEVIAGQYRIEGESTWSDITSGPVHVGQVPVIEKKTKKIVPTPITDNQVKFELRQDKPYPMTISSIEIRAQVENV